MFLKVKAFRTTPPFSLTQQKARSYSLTSQSQIKRYAQNSSMRQTGRKVCVFHKKDIKRFRDTLLMSIYVLTGIKLTILQNSL